MKISVIIPVYNTETYVGKCIKSILNQTVKDLEIIIIDDGSTDQSLMICEKFQKQDSRIVLVSQTNRGVSEARNKGMELATGDWISFIDSDDYLDPDFYETLLKGTNRGASVICCGVRPVNNQDQEIPHLQYDRIPDRPVMLRGRELWKHYLHPSKRYLYWSPWDKLIAASVAKKYHFISGKKLGEDLYYCFQCLNEAAEIYYIPDKKYNYLIREGSATHGGSFQKSAFDSLYFSKRIFREGDSDNCCLYARLNLLIVSARIVRGYYRCADQKLYKDEILETRKLIRKHLKKTDIKELRTRHMLLILEAAYAPFLFGIF